MEVTLVLESGSMYGASIALLKKCDEVVYVLICAACDAIVRRADWPIVMLYVSYYDHTAVSTANHRSPYRMHRRFPR